MALGPDLIYGGIGAAGVIVGWIIRGSRSIADVETLKEGHRKLAEQVTDHHTNFDIHVDPKRDAAMMQGLRDMLASGLEMLNEKLDKIDGRCERRGQTCADHFSRVEQRIAASTGKINGGDK